MRVGSGNPRSEWWNDQVKAAVKRKEDAWKVLGARDEDSRERCLESYKVRRRSKNSLERRWTKM